MFSFDDYREIIRIIKSTGRQCSYAEALNRDSFIIMRHDGSTVLTGRGSLPKWNRAWTLRLRSFSSGLTIPIIYCPERIWISLRICTSGDSTSDCILP